MCWKAEASSVLLEDCAVSAEALAPCLERLRSFTERYQPHFKRREQRELCQVYLQGLLSPLDRKSVEPIATAAGLPRRGLQHFVGAGKWDDEAVLREFRAHVAQELGDPTGLLIVDPSDFPKKGKHSVGVKRQWCGRLGKEENCQSGVFLSYVRAGEKQPIEQYALRRKVQTRSQGRIYPHVETLLVTKTPGPRPEYRYWLSNDEGKQPLEKVVWAASQRYWIERDFQRAKGEVGLADYEVRSWVGWHHHMTLAMLALFFLTLEQRRLG